ncbi:MAG: cytochrome c biogenesis protein CcdA [Candidatus Hydrothermales bacterium]
MEHPSIVVSFMAGFLSFFSPCILPLIPVYFSYITGVSVNELKKKGKYYFLILFHSLLFVLGFSTVFLFLGFSSSLIGSFFLDKREILEKVAGIFIIILSIHLIGLFRFKFLDVERRINPVKFGISFLNSFFVGFAFGFGWTPCIGPVLASILALAATYGSPFKGLLLLGFYSLGLAIPFIISGFFINFFFLLFQKLRKSLRIFEIISGLLLLILGILLLFGVFSKISLYLGA